MQYYCFNLLTYEKFELHCLKYLFLEPLEEDFLDEGLPYFVHPSVGPPYADFSSDGVYEFYVTNITSPFHFYVRLLNMLHEFFCISQCSYWMICFVYL